MGSPRASSGAVTINRAKNNKGFLKRAQRFEIEIPIRYRERGTAVWLEGKTVNISKSGILFCAQQEFRPHAALDVALTLPAAISDEAPAEIGCHGTVVRSTSVSAQDGQHVVAAAISRYRFVHKRRDAES